jgi:uncharacterized membrane protein
MIIGFGILWWIWTRQWISGTVLVLIGAAHFYLVLQVIMPAFSPFGQHVMVSEEAGSHGRYAWLGQSVNEILQTILTQPVAIFKTVMISMGGAVYLFLLFLPFMFFPILGLTFLLPGIADLAANMLPEITLPRSPFSYHSATLIPIFMVAAMHGIKKTTKWVKRFSEKEFSSLRQKRI